jgi:hypothetical protein
MPHTPADIPAVSLDGDDDDDDDDDTESQYTAGEFIGLQNALDQYGREFREYEARI